MNTITVATDFSATPAGRFRTDGKFSGEAFREDILVPSLQKGHVTVVLDGVEGYGSSFLEEAFGGLVRNKWPLTELRKRLHIEARSKEYERYFERAWKYMEEASKR